MIFDLEVARDGNIVLLHQGEHGLSVLPFIKFDLPNCGFLLGTFDRTRMADVRKRRSFLGGVSQLEQPDKLWMLEVQYKIPLTLFMTRT